MTDRDDAETPSWLRELRTQWIEEIRLMPSQHASWFTSKVIFPGVSLPSGPAGIAGSIVSGGGGGGGGGGTGGENSAAASASASAGAAALGALASMAAGRLPLDDASRSSTPSSRDGPGAPVPASHALPSAPPPIRLPSGLPPLGSPSRSRSEALQRWRALEAEARAAMSAARTDERQVRTQIASDMARFRRCGQRSLLHFAEQVLRTGLSLHRFRQTHERLLIEIARAAIVRLQRQPSVPAPPTVLSPALAAAPAPAPAPAMPLPVSAPTALSPPKQAFSLSSAGADGSLPAAGATLSDEESPSPSAASILSGSVSGAGGGGGADGGGGQPARDTGVAVAAAAATGAARSEENSSPADSPAASLRSLPDSAASVPRRPLLSGISDEELMTGPRALVRRVPRVRWLDRTISQLDREYRTLLRSYYVAVRGSRPLARNEWLRRLRLLALQVVSEAASNSGCYFEEVSATQLRFESLLADERVPEGRRFWMLVDGVLAGSIQWEPADLVAFIEALARDLSESCAAPDLAEVLELFISRAIFPRLAQPMFSLPALAPEAARDATFRANATWMRRYQPQDFGVEPEFAGRADGPRPYEPAIDLLSDIALSVVCVAACSAGLVPADCLFSILEAARKMYSCGAEYAAEFGCRGMALGADHLFPIFVWCTVHATVPDICTRIAWLRLFASSRETNSEMGYYLTTLEAAVEHVVRITEERFQAHVTRDRNAAETLAKLLSPERAPAPPPLSVGTPRAQPLSQPAAALSPAVQRIPLTPSRASHIQLLAEMMPSSVAGSWLSADEAHPLAALSSSPPASLDKTTTRSSETSDAESAESDGEATPHPLSSQ